MHRAEEDYLKIIYKLTIEIEKELTKTSEIAQVIGFTDQTVNEMVKRLAKKKVIMFLPYKGVYLTKKGMQEAKRLVRNHRLWEVFLVSNLHYSWIDAHKEAERLEHASSDMLIDRMDVFLNYPSHCVHGNAIPQKDGALLPTWKQALSEINTQQTFVVKRVVEQPDLLVYLDEHKIEMDSQIAMLEKDAYNQTIKIRVKNEEMILSSAIAAKIFGEVINK